MSQFIGNALPTIIITGNDNRISFIEIDIEDRELQDLFVLGSYRTAWWPRNGSFLIGDQSSDVGVLGAEVWDVPAVRFSGMQTRYGISGITRDAYSTPLGGCVCRLFLASSDVLVDQITSDPSGNYLLSTPFFPDQHYVVSYKDGSPPVGGTTVRTLVAS